MNTETPGLLHRLLFSTRQGKRCSGKKGLQRDEKTVWKDVGERKVCKKMRRQYGLQFGFSDPCPIVLQVGIYTLKNYCSRLTLRKLQDSVSFFFLFFFVNMEPRVSSSR